MNYVDLTQIVNEVVVVEGSVRVEDEVHDLRVRAVVPLRRLVDEAPAVYEYQTAHLNKRFDFKWRHLHG